MFTEKLFEIGIESNTNQVLTLGGICALTLKFLSTMQKVLMKSEDGGEEEEENLPVPAAVQTWLDEIFNERPVDWLGVSGMNVLMTHALSPKSATSGTKHLEPRVNFLLCLRGAVIESLRKTGWKVGDGSTGREDPFVSTSQKIIEGGLVSSFFSELNTVDELSSFLVAGAQELDTVSQESTDERQ